MASDWPVVWHPRHGIGPGMSPKTATQAGLEYARKLERKAEEQVDIAKRLEVRSSEILGGEFSDLMRKIARLEEDEKTRKHNEESWKRELDAIVLEQASFMERRDNFRKEMEQLEAIARADGAKVAEAEARVKRAEGKVGKEKLRVELLTRELEALKADAEKARSELQRNAQARRGLQHQEAAASASNTSSLEFWRSVSLCLCAAAAAVGLWRAMDPALW